MKMYDPPSGWQYGFPKEYKPLTPTEPVRDTLIRDGYPPELADKGWPVRFWESTSASQFACGLQLEDEDEFENPYKNNHGN